MADLLVVVLEPNVIGQDRDCGGQLVDGGLFGEGFP